MSEEDVDGHMMNEWMDLVLVSLKNSKVPGVIPIIILDAYHIHMMRMIINKIKSFGIELIHIPAGCMYLWYPIDIGINKSVKT